jgi:hypothetical protein
LPHPLGELVHTLALISHFEVDPEPCCNYGRRVNMMIDLEGPGEDIEKMQGLSGVTE